MNRTKVRFLSIYDELPAGTEAMTDKPLKNEWCNQKKVQIKKFIYTISNLKAKVEKESD